MCDHFVLAGEIQEHGIDRVSLANVPEGSDYLWAHLVAAYLVALLAMYLLDHAYRKVYSTFDPRPGCWPQCCSLPSPY